LTPAFARFDNVFAIKTASGRVVGFHAKNLQVAELDPLVWQALEDPERVPADVRDEVLSWNLESDPAVTDGQPAKELRTLSINVAQICNMRCTYCAAGGDGTYGSKTAKIDLDQIKAQISFLLKGVSEGAKFSLNFIGGEPLIYPQAIAEIAAHARNEAQPKNIQLRFEITTNATLVTPQVAELLADLNAFVTVSIDGPPRINDAVRPMSSGRGSTQLTLRGLQQLFAVHDRLGALACNAVFGAHNVDVVGSYSFLREFNWDMIYLGYAAGDQDAVYSPKYAAGLCDVAELAFSLGGETELRRISQFDHLFRILDGRQRVHNHCGAGKTLLQVDTKGKFYACNWWSGDAAEELGQNLELNREAIAKFAPSLIDLNDCNSCWARYICGGGCMFVNRLRTGDKHRKDTEFCNRTRRIIAKGIEVYGQSRYQESTGD